LHILPHDKTKPAERQGRIGTGFHTNDSFNKEVVPPIRSYCRFAICRFCNYMPESGRKKIGQQPTGANRQDRPNPGTKYVCPEKEVQTACRIHS